jgi:hypothetical protein
MDWAPWRVFWFSLSNQSAAFASSESPAVGVGRNVGASVDGECCDTFGRRLASRARRWLRRVIEFSGDARRGMGCAGGGPRLLLLRGLDMMAEACAMGCKCGWAEWVRLEPRRASVAMRRTSARDSDEVGVVFTELKVRICADSPYA